MIKLIQALLHLGVWRFTLAAVFLSEIFTLLSNSVLSLIWWGRVSGDLLWIGSIDALVVAASVAPVIMYFFRRSAMLEARSEALAKEADEHQAAAREIREREERYRLLFERSGDSILIVEAEGPERGRILEVNQAAVDSHGFTRGELLSMKVSELDTPESARHVPERIQRMLEGDWLKFEITHRTKNGAELPLEVSAGCFEYDGRRLIMAFDRDISARLRTELALKESEEKFSRLFHNSPVWMSLSTFEEGRYLDINEAFARGTGWSREEVLGRTSREIGLWVDGSQRDQGLRLLEREGRLGEMFVALRRKSGEQIIGIWSAERVEIGGIPCLVSVVKDITAHRRAEEALRESERRYRELLDGIDDLIYTHDLEGRVLTINRRACLRVGYSPEEVVGRPMSDFMVPEGRKGFLEEYMPVALRDGEAAGVNKFITKDGQVRYVEYRSRLVREEGREPYMSGSARDITERILAEREMRLLEEQLFQAQKIEALGVLAGGIAHDFNNVLQTISGYAQLIEAQGTASEPNRVRLARIEQSIERAAGMIKRLMTLARRVETSLEPVDLNREVEHTVSILAHTLPRMIRIKARLEPDLPPISGDPSQIEQVLLNLATNAGHAMPQGGRLTFATASVNLGAEECRTLPGLAPGRYVRLTVSDTGQGMDEDTMAHIFEPFFTTKPQGEGTGLGLSTVYGIVANHGGHVGCQSSPGEGATFTMHFQVRGGWEDEVRAAKGRGGPAAGVAGQETILVVDDEPAILESCREALTDFGYRVLTAGSGEDALDILRADPGAAALIIMDLGMPGMGGLRCLEVLRALRPEAKVLVATGYADEEVTRRISELGAAGVLGKPYRFDDLLLRMRSILDA